MGNSCEEQGAAIAADGETIFERTIGAPGRRSYARKAALGLLAMVAVCAVVVQMAPRSQTETQPARSTDEGIGEGIVEEAGLMALALSAAKASMGAAKLVGDTREGYADFNSVWSEMSKPEKEAALEIAKEKHKNMTQHYISLKGKQLIPKNNKNDNNQCPDGEELFASTCFAKCSGLTNHQYPVRTTAFSCCMQEPCSFFNSKFSNPLKLCSGFNVAGKVGDKYCPHQAGDCLRNEEFNLGICYMKCSVLTLDHFPYRQGPNTCCKYHNHMACLDPLNTQVSPDFNSGGGYDDELFNDTARTAHMPMPELAEMTTTTTQPTLPPVLQAALQSAALGMPVVPPMPVVAVPPVPVVLPALNQAADGLVGPLTASATGTADIGAVAAPTGANPTSPSAALPLPASATGTADIGAVAAPTDANPTSPSAALPLPASATGTADIDEFAPPTAAGAVGGSSASPSSDSFLAPKPSQPADPTVPCYVDDCSMR